jgi:hypothetical protein
VETRYFLYVLAALGLITVVVVGFGRTFTTWLKRDWKQAQGRVTGEPEVNVITQEDSVSFELYWDYEFSVDGFPFTGRLRVSQQDMDLVDSFIVAMRAGTPVNVLYDPHDPSRSEGVALESELLRITPRN